MNILNSDSVGGLFKQVFNLSSSEILVLNDELLCGPLKEFTKIEDWVPDRESYWNTIFSDNLMDPIPFNEYPRDFYSSFEELKTSDEINLWIGCSLSDQLALAFVVFLMDHLNLSLDKLSIVQFVDLYDNKGYWVRGLGELDPDQIKQHPDAFKLNDIQITFCLNVWQAVTHKSPEKLLELLSIEITSLPILHRALQGLLFRYPKHSNGLSDWDEALLKFTKTQGPLAVGVIGHVLGVGMMKNDEQDLDAVGDWYLFSRLKNLARPSLAQPLLSLNALNLSMRETEVEITELGNEVLEERENMANVNGINDWVGGVHLDSASGHMWFRKDQDLLYKSGQGEYRWTSQ